MSVSDPIIEQRPLLVDPAHPKLSGLDPVLARVYAARGIDDPEQLGRRLQELLPDSQMKGISAAVERLLTAFEQRQKILIVGDFDCDGATSTTVALLGLRMLGVAEVDYLVPNRFEYGYGLSPEIVDVAAQASPDLLITVDNGISSIEGVSRARELGIDVIVTDHHLAGAELPEACAIVNPNQPGCDFIAKSTCGVGVIFYVLIALRRALNARGWFNGQPPNLASLLDLVALGTVADVVPLERNNRALVWQGLQRIRAGQARARAAGADRGVRSPPRSAGRQRSGFRHRAAPQCRRSSGRYVDRYRVPAGAELRPGADHGAGAGRAEQGAPWHRAGDAAAGAGAARSAQPQRP